MTLTIFEIGQSQFAEQSVMIISRLIYSIDESYRQASYGLAGI